MFDRQTCNINALNIQHCNLLENIIFQDYYYQNVTGI